MNWMGGVRNRIKVNQEKKQQKEYFERKKFEQRVKRNENLGEPSSNRGLNLDLLSLNTINKSMGDRSKRERSGTPGVNGGAELGGTRKIRRVELEHTPGSVTRRSFSTDLELPNMSPIRHISQLQLDEKVPAATPTSTPDPSRTKKNPFYSPIGRSANRISGLPPHSQQPNVQIWNNDLKNVGGRSGGRSGGVQDMLHTSTPLTNFRGGSRGLDPRCLPLNKVVKMENPRKRYRDPLCDIEGFEKMPLRKKMAMVDRRKMKEDPPAGLVGSHHYWSERSEQVTKPVWEPRSRIEREPRVAQDVPLLEGGLPRAARGMAREAALTESPLITELRPKQNQYYGSTDETFPRSVKYPGVKDQRSDLDKETPLLDGFRPIGQYGGSKRPLKDLPLSEEVLPHHMQFIERQITENTAVNNLKYDGRKAPLTQDILPQLPSSSTKSIKLQFARRNVAERDIFLPETPLGMTDLVKKVGSKQLAQSHISKRNPPTPQNSNPTHLQKNPPVNNNNLPDARRAEVQQRNDRSVRGGKVEERDKGSESAVPKTPRTIETMTQNWLTFLTGGRETAVRPKDGDSQNIVKEKEEITSNSKQQVNVEKTTEKVHEQKGDAQKSITSGVNMNRPWTNRESKLRQRVRRQTSDDEYLPENPLEALKVYTSEESEFSPSSEPCGDSFSTRTEASSPARTSGQVSSPARTSGQVSSPARTSGHDSSPVRTSGHGSSPARTCGQDSSPVKTSGQVPSPVRTSGHDSSPARTSGHDSSPAKTNEQVSIPAKTSEQVSSPAKTSGQVSSPARTSDHDSSPARTSGHDSSPVRTSGHGSSPARTCGHDSSPAKTSGQVSSPVRTSGHDSSPAKTNEQVSIPANTSEQVSSPARTSGQVSSPARTSGQVSSPSRPSEKVSSSALTNKQVSSSARSSGRVPSLINLCLSHISQQKITTNIHANYIITPQNGNKAVSDTVSPQENDATDINTFLDIIMEEVVAKTEQIYREKEGMSLQDGAVKIPKEIHGNEMKMSEKKSVRKEGRGGHSLYENQEVKEMAKGFLREDRKDMNQIPEETEKISINDRTQMAGEEMEKISSERMEIEAGEPMEVSAETENIVTKNIAKLQPGKTPAVTERIATQEPRKMEAQAPGKIVAYAYKIEAQESGNITEHGTEEIEAESYKKKSQEPKEIVAESDKIEAQEPGKIAESDELKSQEPGKLAAREPGKISAETDKIEAQEPGKIAESDRIKSQEPGKIAAREPGEISAETDKIEAQEPGKIAETDEIKSQEPGKIAAQEPQKIAKEKPGEITKQEPGEMIERTEVRAREERVNRLSPHSQVGGSERGERGGKRWQDTAVQTDWSMKTNASTQTEQQDE